VSAAVQSLEDDVRTVRAEIAEQREKLGRAELSLRESELKLHHLDESIQEKWGVALATWEPPVADADETENAEAAAAPAATSPPGADATADDGEDSEPSPDAAKEARANALLAQAPTVERRKHLDDVRKKLASLGDVNLGAIEEHEELNERYRFLSDQKADLEGTLTSLREAIARINRTSRRRFRETHDVKERTPPVGYTN
jgi:chromosome segregation ATPase